MPKSKKEQNIGEKAYPAWFSIILACILWVEAIAVTVACALFNLIFILPFSVIFEPGRRGWVHEVAHRWARIILALVPIWKVTAQGQQNIQPNRPYVMVANHQSLLDILVVLACLPVHFKFLAKHELFHIPLFGWHMRVAGYIPLVRSSKESGKQAIETAESWLKKGISVLFFPEGTRSTDGEIKGFKMGAFKIARRLGLDILPVVIDGTGAALPKKSWRLMKNTHFKISIEPPVPAEKISSDIENVKNRIRGDMIRRLSEMRSGK